MSAALLACKGVTCRFGGLVALARVDFEVNDGEIVGLIGPNGSGKTTLFNVVTGIYGADEGAVTFAGTDMTAATPQAIYRAGVTRTFQRSRMCLPLSVFDNIMVGNHKRLNHGLVFNLLRRGAFAAELARNREEAHELVKVFSPELADAHRGTGGRPADDRSPPDRDLPCADQPAAPRPARRAIGRHDARGNAPPDGRHPPRCANACRA